MQKSESETFQLRKKYNHSNMLATSTTLKITIPSIGRSSQLNPLYIKIAPSYTATTHRSNLHTIVLSAHQHNNLEALKGMLYSTITFPFLVTNVTI